MFTKEEQKYMNEKLKLGIDFNNMTDDDWIKIEETVGDHLTLHCLDKNSSPNEEGWFCYGILDKLDDD